MCKFALKKPPKSPPTSGKFGGLVTNGMGCKALRWICCSCCYRTKPDAWNPLGREIEVVVVDAANSGDLVVDEQPALSSLSAAASSDLQLEQ